MEDVKIDFENIKKVVISEKYTGTKMEIAALNGDLAGVAKLMKNGDNAGAVMQLIRSGMSEKEALMSVKG